MNVVVVDASSYWTEQLFKQCARFSDVLLIKPLEFRAHRARTGSFRSDTSPRPIAPGVWEQQMSFPPGWMVEFWPWSQRRLEKAIRNFAREGPLTLVVTYPQYRGLFQALKPALSLYYNYDDYRDNWPRYRTQVAKWESATVEHSDLTICIADYRARLLRDLHPSKSFTIHHIPIGVTPDFMAKEESRPTSTNRTSSVRAGYVGALNYRFDLRLIVEVAGRLPNVQFVLGGNVSEDGDAAWRAALQRARRLPNLKFIGWVDHSALGETLAGFDVLLMPYSHCHFNTNACPAKLWDYLGSGKPIVATNANPETTMWSHVVAITESPVSFAEAISAALSETDPQRRNRRLSIAREHTWERLSYRIEELLTSAPSPRH